MSIKKDDKDLTMTVKELIEKLSKLPQDMEVYAYTLDGLYYPLKPPSEIEIGLTEEDFWYEAGGIPRQHYLKKKRVVAVE